eukprot:gnl/TRDRNA2_/TRDRNA2_116569_c2_seq1.p1 gnl/TRDRNA2_/TRDRNA2_116569_c2~~gnl/TRDRNA2_/TRDRNA2_116569_c2_seq1.p1  ORF type:complete len:379 (-),score=41.46 gnl/TRDRNA2_/TRDRNA2_116569_c2_seq1:149-1207(-)
MGFQRLGNVTNAPWGWYMVETGEVRVVFRSTPTVTRHSSVSLELTVYSSIKRVDFAVHLSNWTNAFGVANRVAFPIKTSTRNVSFATPFGETRVGQDELEGSMDEWQVDPGPDVPKFERGWAMRPREALDWIHAEADGVGVTISSPDVGLWDWQDASGAYGSNSVVLAPEMLIHTNSNQGPFLDESGNHTFRFSIFATEPGQNEAALATQSTTPLSFVSRQRVAAKAHVSPAAKVLGQSGSFLSIKSQEPIEGTVVVTALKKEDSGHGVIARLYQPGPFATKARFVFHPSINVSNIEMTSIIELDPKPIEDTDAYPIKLAPSSIETFRFEVGLGRDMHAPKGLGSTDFAIYV